MISVASIMRGAPMDFPEKKAAAVPASTPDVCQTTRDQICANQYEKNSYYANYEVFSTLTPTEHERSGMRFPFYADDPV